MKYVLLALALSLTSCGASGSSAPSVQPQPSPPTSRSETITAGPSATAAPLPSVGGYTGQLLLPSGSGTARLTLSSTPPAGLPALGELTPSPPIIYITLTAQSSFSLSASPGLNLTPGTFNFFLNQYDGQHWLMVESSWSNAGAVATACFAMFGNAVTLAPGQSLYFGVTGDNVLPSPTGTSFPPCPQSV